MTLMSQHKSEGMYSQFCSGASNPSTLSWFQLSSNEGGKLKEGEGGGRKDQISMQQVLDDYELQHYSTALYSNQTSHNLDGDGVSKKRRKTKFDIAPESVSDSSNTKSNKWITTEELISMDNNLGFYLSSNQSSAANDHLPLNYIPAEDETFRQRIKKALQKNFEYIEKLDRLALEQKLYGFATLTSSTLTTPSNTNIRNKFQDKFNKAKIPDKKGIGIEADLTTEKTPAVLKAETNRVYVSNLPKDITEEEIEILFSPQGKIKKIKLYTDKEGKKKGDCLITFVSPDSASSSLKLNKLNIGDGHIISVTKAEFQTKDQQPSAPKSLEERLQEMAQQLHSSSSSSSSEHISLLLQTIPDKSVTENNPLVFLWNAYELDAEDLAEIETDLLLQACTFGNVKAIQMYEFPQKTIDKICRQNTEEDNDDGLIKEESSSVMLGGVVIVFEEVSSALSCCNFLSGQYFSDRKLFSFAYIPDRLQPPPPQLDALQTEQKDGNHTNDEIALLQDNNNTDDIEYDDAIRKEVEDVEDFLNSLM